MDNAANRPADPAGRLPRWDELPDLELYMDQVLSLTERYLRDCSVPEERRLTASMVNNYVKMGVMPPPVRKRYTRSHLADLLMICLLKASLPIASVRQLLAARREALGEEGAYAAFRAMFEEESGAAAAALAAREGEDPSSLACRSALRAGAERALAEGLCPAAGR